MPEIITEDFFKTTLMGGFDKEDVISKYQSAVNEAEAGMESLRKELQEKDAEIAELKSKLDNFTEDVEKKYQGYMENVDMIGRIICDSRIESEKLVNKAKEDKDNIINSANEKAATTIREAEEKAVMRIAEADASAKEKLDSANKKAAAIVDDAERKAMDMVADADTKAKSMIEAAQRSVDDKLKEGANNYITIQEEVSQLMQLVNKVQHQFMKSVKEIHEITDSMNVNSNIYSDLED